MDGSRNPLVVKVTDGNNRPVAGVAVAFDSTQNGMFIPVPGTTVYTDITTDVDLVDNTEDTTEALAQTARHPVKRYGSKLIAAAWHKFTISLVLQRVIMMLLRLVQGSSESHQNVRCCRG